MDKAKIIKRNVFPIKGGTMNNKLEELIIYFIHNYPRYLNRTELVKMIYLFEYVHFHTFCTQYTEVTFVRYNHGPYSREIIDCADSLCFQKLITYDEFKHSQGGHWYQYRPASEVHDFQANLDEDRLLIADYIIEKTSKLSFKGILSLVYSTPPMEKILETEKSWGCTLKEREIHMSEAKPLRKFSKDKIAAARKRLDLSSKGSDNEYYEHLLDQQKKMEPLRRRATSCLPN